MGKSLLEQIIELARENERLRIECEALEKKEAELKSAIGALKEDIKAARARGQ